MEMVKSVVIGGQEVDLGKETSVEDAVSMLENMGMGNHTEGTRPTVVDGTLSFEQQNGEKGTR